MNSETPQVDELVHRITNNPGVTWSHSEICEMIELAMRLELRNRRLVEAFPFPELSEGNLTAICYHFRKGKANGGITREGLVLFLESLRDGLKKYSAALADQQEDVVSTTRAIGKRRAEAMLKKTDLTPPG